MASPNETSISQAEIDFLISDGALDDKNIPEDKSSPDKSSPMSSPKSSPTNIKVSGRILNNRARFFGKGTSREEVINTLSQEGGDFKKPTGSPPKSPKKKVQSPIKVTRNHPIKSFARNSSKSPSPKRFNSSQSLQRSPGASSTNQSSYTKSPNSSPLSSPSAKKCLNFALSPIKQENTSAGTELQSDADGKYYFDSFYNIIQIVRSDKRAGTYFTEKELGILNNVKRQQPELHLYVRLMNRVDTWKATSSISYPEISSDLEPLFSKLEEDGYITFDMSKEPIEEVLKLLKMDDLKNLCKLFKQKIGSDTKEEKVERLCNFFRTQKSTFSTVNPLRKQAEKELGRCFRLAQAPRLLFRRCALIFSLFHSSDELDELFKTQSLLFLEIKRGNMVFPIGAIDVYDDYHIYDNRDQLLRYEKAREVRQEMYNAKDLDKDLDKVETLTEEVIKEFKYVLSLDDERSASSLPIFLRRWRAGTVYARILESSAESLRTGKNIELARKAVRVLQKQSTYLPNHAGRWAVLLATILQVNCKDNSAAAEELCRGFEIPDISTVDRISLNNRAQLVIKRKKNGIDKDLAKKLGSFLDPPLQDPVSVEIQARSTNLSKPGMKRIFVRNEGDGGRVYRSVEEEVLEYYRFQGYNGRHDEGSLIRSLCVLSMWDVIYDPKFPSVFLSQYQDKPLDWGSREFYKSRRQKIEERLEFLRAAGVEGLAALLLSSIEQHHGTVSLVVWDAFENIAVEDVLVCLSIDVFLAICQRLLQDYRSHRSGLPDLTLWNIEEGKCLFAEVKGPGDTLSAAQILWLEYLRKNGAEAVVANVRATGSKEVNKK